MSSINTIQARPFTLSEPIGYSETEIAVKNLLDIYGNRIVMSGDIQFVTIDPLSSENQEIISCTGMEETTDSITTLTGVTRGLDAQPDPVTGLYGSDPANVRSHGANITCILSDNPQVWDKKTSKDEAETITEQWTFDVSPLVPNPTLPEGAVNLQTLQGTAFAGATDATEAAKGLARLSVASTVTIGTCTISGPATPAVVTIANHGLTLNDTVIFTTTGTLPTGLLPSTTYYVISAGLTSGAFEVAATLGGTAINTTGAGSGTHTVYRTTPVAVGANDTRLPTQGENDALVGSNADIAVGTGNKYETQTGFQKGAELYGASAGGTDTYAITLSPVPTSLVNGMRLRFKADVANTGAATLDVNGLGALALVTGLSTPLVTGDIVANQIVEVVYNSTGTVWQVLNPATAILSVAGLLPALDGSLLTNVTFGTITNLTQMVASATTIKTHAGTSTASATYVEQAAWTSTFYGQIRLHYVLAWAGAAGTAYARVYVNGIAVGTERTTTTSATFDDDFTVNYGDRISLYCKAVGTSPSTTTSALEIRGSVTAYTNFNALV